MSVDAGVGLEWRAVLARGTRVTDVRIAAGCELLEVAADWAAINPGDGLCAQHTVLDQAGERAMIIAGDGTPAVAETAPATLGLEIRMNPGQAARLMSDALDLQFRLPRTWALVRAGWVEIERARRLAFRTRLLTPAQADRVDAEIAPMIMTVAWARLDKKIDAAIKEADPEGTRRREEAAARWRGVRKARETEDGLIELLFRIDADDGLALYAMCQLLADGLIKHRDDLPEGVSDRGAVSKDEWCAVAAGLLQNPFNAARVLIELNEPDLFDALVDTVGPDTDVPDLDLDADAPWSQPAAPVSAGRGSSRSRHAGVDHRDMDHDDAVHDDAVHDESGHDESDHGGADHGGAERPGDVAAANLADLELRQRSVARAAAIRALVRAIDPHRLLPRVLLNIHLSEDAIRGDHPIARVEELGPQLVSTVRAWLQSGVRIDLRPVIDPAEITAVDRYEVPERMRQALLARSPASVFPFAGCLSPRTDVDHTIPYRPPPDGPPGQTGLHNLGPLTRSEHRAKTFGRLGVRQPEPGVFVWRAQTGRVIITNPAGTHDLGTGHLAEVIWHASKQSPAERVVQKLITAAGPERFAPDR